MPEAEPLYDDDTGEHVGWTQEQDDGGILAYDIDGELLGAAYGQEWYDADQLEYADGGAGSGGQAAALDQRLDALEAAVSAPREVEYYSTEPEPDPERMTASLMQQAAHMEAKLGRPLTQGEKRTLGRRSPKMRSPAPTAPTYRAPLIVSPLRAADRGHRQGSSMSSAPSASS
jgi:hypothetical protein